MKAKLYGIAAILIGIIEIILCFNGPMAFVQKPQLMICPIYYMNGENEDTPDVYSYVEQQFVGTKSYSLVNQTMIDDYVRTYDYDLKPTFGDWVAIKDYIKFAAHVGIDRLVSVSLSESEQIKMVIKLWDVKTGTEVKVKEFNSGSYEDLLNGVDVNKWRFSIRDTFYIEIKGISFYDWLVVFLFGFQILLGIGIFLGFRPGALAQAIIAPALILFIFTFIYALNANMDYVQRFIASQGQIRLAESTEQEQLFAAIRFLPLILLNLAAYAWERIKRFELFKKAEGFSNKLKVLISEWAFLWSLFSAFLFALSFPSFASLEGIPILGWICLVPLLLVLIYSKPGQAVFCGVMFGGIQGLFINFWHGTFGYVALHFMELVYLFDYLLFMLILVFLIRKLKHWGFLVVPFLWTFFDLARSLGYIGYPWGFLGTSQYSFLPIIQAASVTGVWGVSFLLLLVNAAVAWTIARPAMDWKKWTGTLNKVFPLVVAAPVFLVFLIGGLVSLGMYHSTPKDPDETKNVTITLIQQNTDPRKHDFFKNMQTLKGQTNKSLKEWGGTPDLIVWSEGAFSYDIRRYRDSDYKHSTIRDFLAYQKELGTWLLTGTTDHAWLEKGYEKERRQYNSSILLDPQGDWDKMYHKMHLVPFSEYFPYKEEMPWLYEILDKFNISDWEVGTERLIFEHEKMRFFTPICFEDVFPDDIRRFVLNDADMIVNISNDFWSLTPVEAMQHGVNALFRAVENRRPMVRSTACGLTAYIDPTGAIQPGALDFYVEGYLNVTVPVPAKEYTLYTLWGDWFPIMCGILSLLCLLLIIIDTVRKRAPKEQG